MGIRGRTYSRREAASRYARPPLIAQRKVITGVVDLQPDGITYVDHDYDERKGDALKPLGQDKGGFPIGAAERERVYQALERDFYLANLNLPLGDREMTAYEVSERVKQYRRANLPLFAPIEKEYNGRLCEATFELAMSMGQLGSAEDVPQGLQGQDVEFRFKSPLTADEERNKMTWLSQVRNELRAIAEVETMQAPATDNFDFDTALRDAIEGMGAPSTWLRSVDMVQEIREARAAAQMAQMQAAAEAGGDGANVG